MENFQYTYLLGNLLASTPVGISVYSSEGL